MGLYEKFIKKYDVEEISTCAAHGTHEIAAMDLWGKCKDVRTNSGSSSENLEVNSDDFASMTTLSQKMQALHKIWGETPEWKHGGVTNQNIGVASGETVKLYNGQIF